MIKTQIAQAQVDISRLTLLLQAETLKKEPWMTGDQARGEGGKFSTKSGSASKSEQVDLEQLRQSMDKQIEDRASSTIAALEKLSPEQQVSTVAALNSPEAAKSQNLIANVLENINKQLYAGYQAATKQINNIISRAGQDLKSIVNGIKDLAKGVDTFVKDSVAAVKSDPIIFETAFKATAFASIAMLYKLYSVSAPGLILIYNAIAFGEFTEAFFRLVRASKNEKMLRIAKETKEKLEKAEKQEAENNSVAASSFIYLYN